MSHPPTTVLGPFAPMTTSTAAPVTIGRFMVLRQIGSGAMGVVYSAYDSELDRRVAIKLLHDGLRGEHDDGGESHLLHEAQAMARVSHPNVAAIYEVGVVLGQVFIAMELVHGQTLRVWLAAHARTWREVLGVYLQAARGLMAAHAQGIIHRDFKPKCRRPSQTAPQPTDRPHSHSQGRFERVDVYRAAPERSGVPQVLAKRWQWAGPPEDRRGLAPRPQSRRTNMPHFRLTRTPRLHPELPPVDDPDLPAPSARTLSPDMGAASPDRRSASRR